MEGNSYEMMNFTVTQKQSVKKKNLEGKKQMLYTTFSNLINILEEIERRQLQQAGKVPIPRSSTEWFDHSGKTIDTLDNVAQAQMIVLESMFKTAQHNANQPLKNDLLNKTRNWIAVRQERKLEIESVDKYAYMLLETIAFGKTSHDPAFISTRSVDCKPTDKDTNNLFWGMYEADRRGKQFEDNPSKEATCHEIRSGKVKLVQITCSSKLIWGLDNTGLVHSLELYNPTAWKSVDTQTVTFKAVKTDIYDKGVYAVGINGILYRREGMISDNATRTGYEWKIFDPTRHFKVINVETCGTYMMLQNTNYEFWYYCIKKNTLYPLLPSNKSAEIEQFSCGQNFFWGVDHLNNVFYGAFEYGWEPFKKYKEVNRVQVNTCGDGEQVCINVESIKGAEMYLAKRRKGYEFPDIQIYESQKKIRQVIMHFDYYVAMDDCCTLWKFRNFDEKWNDLPHIKQDNADEWSLRHLSSNGRCIWAVDNFGKISVRQDSDNGIIQWQTIPIEEILKHVRFSQVFVSAYHDSVWFLDDKGKPYCRHGISREKPQGKSWEHVDFQGKFGLHHLSLAPTYVMALDHNGKLWRRNISKDDPVGSKWENQPFCSNDILHKSYLLHISSTGQCTWVVDTLGNISEIQETNNGWQIIRFLKKQKRHKFTKVFVCPFNNDVWALNDKGNLYCWLGLATSEPDRRSWKQTNLPEKRMLHSLTLTPNYVLALDQNRDVWCRNISRKYPIGQAWEKQLFFSNEILFGAQKRSVGRSVHGSDENWYKKAGNMEPRRRANICRERIISSAIKSDVSQSYYLNYLSEYTSDIR